MERLDQGRRAMRAERHSTPDRPAVDSPVHLVTAPSGNGFDELERVVAEVIDAGVSIVQFREKHRPAKQLVERATRLVALCHARGARLIVNDRLDVALAAGADGVHLGIDDLPWDRARALAPAPFILGTTAATDARVAQAIACGADYIGAGPVRHSNTKSDTGPLLTLDDFGALAARAAGRIPVVAIGGIARGDGATLIGAGCDAIAISSAILDADSPGKAAARFVLEVRRAREAR